jgi:cupin fold WbuC family metalloprotein
LKEDLYNLKLSNNITQVSENVYRCIGDIACLDKKLIRFIKNKASISPLKRARINFHDCDADDLHEMIIAMTNDTIVEPHMHPCKKESFHVLEGIVRIGFLSVEGKVDKVIELSNDGIQYYKLNKPFWHIVIPISEVCVIHETTNGPFINNESSVYSDWTVRRKNEIRKQVINSKYAYK